MSDKHKFTQARQDSNPCAGITWLCMCLSGPDVCACTCRLSTWAWECVLVVWCTGVCMHACVCACECCMRAWLHVYVWVLRACVGACVRVSVACMQFVCMRACVYNHHTSSCVLKQTAQHTNTRPPCPLCPRSWLRTTVQIFFCRLFSFLLARCPCVARNIKMHLYDLFILWEKRMNEGRPYLQMWRGVWVPFCKIAIVSFLSVRYKSDGLYCRMAGTPSSPTLFFIRVYFMYFIRV